MSVVMVIDRGRREGVLVVADSATHTSNVRGPNLEKLIVQDGVAVAITGAVKVTKYVRQALAAPAFAGAAVDDKPRVFEDLLDELLVKAGAGGEEWPRTYETNLLLLLRDSSTARIWSETGDLSFQPVKDGPACDPYPVGYAGSGGSIAAGAYLAAGRRSRTVHPLRVARRAVAAACELCAWCKPPIKTWHLWGPKPAGI